MKDKRAEELIAAYKLADESFYSLTKQPYGKPVGRTPALTALFALAYEYDALYRRHFGGGTACPTLTAWHEDEPTINTSREHAACNCEKCRRSRLSSALRYARLFCEKSATRTGEGLEERRRAGVWILARVYNQLVKRGKK